jgi:hypothetical protein
LHDGRLRRRQHDEQPPELHHSRGRHRTAERVRRHGWADCDLGHWLVAAAERAALGRPYDHARQLMAVIDLLSMFADEIPEWARRYEATQQEFERRYRVDRAAVEDRGQEVPPPISESLD